MIEKFKIHPGEAAEEEDRTRGNEPSTPEEMAEAREAAGVTTHEEVMRRFVERQERMKAEGQEKMDWHNPEDFRFFEKKLEEAVEKKEISLDGEWLIDLFGATGEVRYFDQAVKYIKDTYSDKEIIYFESRLAEMAKKLIREDKPEFISKIINLETISRGHEGIRQSEISEIVELLLEKGLKEEAERYLPGKTVSIEKALEKNKSYKAAYIRGLIKAGNFDEAREFLKRGDLDNWGRGLEKMFYLAAGKKSEDLKMAPISDIFELLEDGETDAKEAGNLIREKLKSASGWDKTYRCSYLGRLIKFFHSPEDIQWAEEMFDELSKEIKEEKIDVHKNLGHVNPVTDSLRLTNGLISSKLEPEKEEKILKFLEKFDLISEAKEKQYKESRKSLLTDLAKSLHPENKKIQDFILKRAQLLGTEFADDTIFELGTKAQRERILDQLGKEIVINKKRAEKSKAEGRDREEYEISEVISDQERRLLRFGFRHYIKGGMDEKDYPKVVEIIKQHEWRADEHFGRFLNNRIEEGNYREALKFLGDSQIKPSLFRGIKTENLSKLVEYFNSRKEFDKVEEIVKITNYRNPLIVQLVVGIYKKEGKEAADEKLVALLQKKEKGDKKDKKELLFNSCLELMKLTK